MSSFSFYFHLRPGETAPITGTARVENDRVVVEYRRQTQFFPRQEPVRELVFEFADVQSAEYHQGWFRAKVHMSIRKLGLVNDVIGAHPNGGLALWVTRDQRAAARKFTSILALKLSEAALAAMRDPLTS